MNNSALADDSEPEADPAPAVIQRPQHITGVCTWCSRAPIVSVSAPGLAPWERQEELCPLCDEFFHLLRIAISDGLVPSERDTVRAHIAQISRWARERTQVRREIARHSGCQPEEPPQEQGAPLDEETEGASQSRP